MSWRGVLSPLRTVLFWMHLSVAAAAGVVIIVLAATGIGLAYQRQALAAVAESHRIVPPARPAGRRSLDSIAAALPGGASQMTSVTVSGDEGLPLTIGLADRRSLFVDPYTGGVVGSDARVRGVFQAIERVHRSLAPGTGTRSATGTAVTGAANLAFCFLVLSGMVLWWPRQWSRRAFQAVLLLDRSARGRARDWNWHHVLGFWFAPVILLLAGTALFMSYSWPQQMVATLAGVPAAARAGGGRAEGGRRRASTASVQAIASIDRLLASATPTGPFTSLQLRLPQNGARTAIISIAYGTAGRPDRREQITVDAASGEVKQRERYADYDLARKMRAWVRPVHTGEAGGLLGQTLAALASAATVVLGITGLTLAFRRLRARARRRSAAQRPEPFLAAPSHAARDAFAD